MKEKYDFDIIYERKNSEKWMEQKRKFGAEGLISLWEADMDFLSPKPVVDALVTRAKEGIYGYVHKPASYNQAICQWMDRQHHYKIKEEWLSYSPMIMTAVLIFIKLFSKPKDKVVYTTPIYYPFYSTIKNTGRQALHSPMIYDEKGRYNLDLANIEEQFKAGGKVFILLNPYNPAGMVWTPKELQELGEMCVKYDVKIIADEAHSDFALGNHKYTPFASLSESFESRTMTLLSPGKTFNLAGIHQSVVVISNPEMQELFDKEFEKLELEKNNCFSLEAVEAGYRYGGVWLNQVKEYIENNMDYVIEFCKNRMPMIKAYKPEGTYLMWLDFRALGMNGKTLGDFMVNKAKVGMGEGYWFGEAGAGFERLNVACPRAILAQALENISKAIDERETVAGK